MIRVSECVCLSKVLLRFCDWRRIPDGHAHVVAGVILGSASIPSSDELSIGALDGARVAAIPGRGVGYADGLAPGLSFVAAELGEHAILIACLDTIPIREDDAAIFEPGEVAVDLVLLSHATRFTPGYAVVFGREQIHRCLACGSEPALATEMKQSRFVARLVNDTDALPFLAIIVTTEVPGPIAFRLRVLRRISEFAAVAGDMQSAIVALLDVAKRDVVRPANIGRGESFDLRPCSAAITAATDPGAEDVIAEDGLFRTLRLLHIGPARAEHEEIAILRQTSRDVHSVGVRFIRCWDATLLPKLPVLAVPAFSGSGHLTVARLAEDRGINAAIRHQREVRPRAHIVDGDEALERLSRE